MRTSLFALMVVAAFGGFQPIQYARAGVVLEGKVGDLGSVTSVRYEPALNAFVLDDRAVYFSPIPAHSAAMLARAIAEDDRIGVSIAPVLWVYGMLPYESDVALDLMLADRFLTDFIFTGPTGGPPGYRLANGFVPTLASTTAIPRRFSHSRTFNLRFATKSFSLRAPISTPASSRLRSRGRLQTADIYPI
jgi:hypothetical protein